MNNEFEITYDDGLEGGYVIIGGNFEELTPRQRLDIINKVEEWAAEEKDKALDQIKKL